MIYYIISYTYIGHPDEGDSGVKQKKQIIKTNKQQVNHNKQYIYTHRTSR